VGHGSALCGAHPFAVGRVQVVETGQMEVPMNEIEGQFLGEGQAPGSFELESVHGGHADLAGDAGLGGAFESDHIGQAVILKEIRMDPTHVFAGKEGDRKLAFGCRPSVESVENLKNPSGIGDRD
jgi:hypothetical protein